MTASEIGAREVQMETSAISSVTRWEGVVTASKAPPGRERKVLAACGHYHQSEEAAVRCARRIVRHMRSQE